MRARLHHGLATALVAALASSAAGAQSLYTVDGGGTLVAEFSGPPGFGAGCPYPAGGALAAISLPFAGAPCSGLPVVATGAVATDPLADVVYVSDATRVAAYTAAGTFLDSWQTPLPAVTGLAVDGAAGILYLTDGSTVVGVVPPPGPGSCLLPPPPIAVGPIPVPVGPGRFSSPITDLAFEPATGSFFGVDSGGIAGNFTAPAGATGPFGFATATAACGLLPALTGVAVDRALPGSGTIYVTDGLAVSYLTMPGALAAPTTFYTNVSCGTVPTAAFAGGLAFAGRALSYGPASGGTVPLPTAGAMGQTAAGNAAFALTVTGPPASAAALFLGAGGPACPPLPGGAISLDVLPPLIFLGAGALGAGTLVFPAPLPPAAGLAVDVQWAVVAGATSAASQALRITLTAP